MIFNKLTANCIQLKCKAKEENSEERERRKRRKITKILKAKTFSSFHQDVNVHAVGVVGVVVGDDDDEQTRILHWLSFFCLPYQTICCF